MIIVVHFTYSCPKLLPVFVNLSACPVGSHTERGQLLCTEIFNTGSAQMSIHKLVHNDKRLRRVQYIYIIFLI